MPELRYEELADRIGEVINRLNIEAEEGALVVVEGARDAEALRLLGFRDRPFMLCRKGGLRRLVEEALSFEKVVLMLDMDREGMEMARRVESLLSSYGKRVDGSYQRLILELTEGRVRHVEELKSFVQG